jgi:hypothetical protein
MNHSHTNHYPSSFLSNKEFTNFEEAIVSQRMRQMDCEWGWFCTAEDENNPNTIYPSPVMRFTHKKDIRPILVNKQAYAMVSPTKKASPIAMDLSELEEEKDYGIASKKMFYYLSHCAIFSVIVLISTYA